LGSSALSLGDSTSGERLGNSTVLCESNAGDTNISPRQVACMKDANIFPKKFRHPNSSTAGRRFCTFMLPTLELDKNSKEDMCLILESFTDTYFKV
jgi:hypothetical protein